MMTNENAECMWEYDLSSKMIKLISFDFLSANQFKQPFNQKKLL